MGRELGAGHTVERWAFDRDPGEGFVAPRPYLGMTRMAVEQGGGRFRGRRTGRPRKLRLLTLRKIPMRVLACFLLCSMLGGASEVLFAEAKNSIKGWCGRTARKFPVASDAGQMRVPFVGDYVHSIEPNDGGLDSEQTPPGSP